MSHSPEPWNAECEYGDAQIYDQNGDAVLPEDGWYDDSVEGREEKVRETLDRIVACVNACAGVPIETLQQVIRGECVLLLGSSREFQESLNAGKTDPVRVCPTCERPMPPIVTGEPT